MALGKLPDNIKGRRGNAASDRVVLADAPVAGAHRKRRATGSNLFLSLQVGKFGWIVVSGGNHAMANVAWV